MMEPYPLKKRPAGHDPNPGEAKPRVRIALAGQGHYVVEHTAAMNMLETELEMMLEEPDSGDELRISIVMLSDEGFEALPEFEGW